MKKVFLYAYDKQNLGDDLFVHTITRRYSDVQFYMWTDRKNRETFASLPNLRVIDKDSQFVRLLQWLRPSLIARYKGFIEGRCDAVVYIGGSIFMEYPNWEQICNWWEWTAKNRPFYVLGANFGPWHTEGYRDKMAKIFEKMQDVCFRDKYSLALFPEVDTVRCAPDILFSYPMPKVPMREKQIFVSAIDCAGRDEAHDLSRFDKQYVSNMSSLLRGYLDGGYRLVLASFCKDEGDENGIAKILSAMGCENDSRVRVLAYDGTNADALTTSIAESEFVIGTRFHSVILAMAAGKPVFPVVYSDKTTRVLEDMDFRSEWGDLRTGSSFAKSSPPPPLVGVRFPAVETLSTAAQLHFNKLDSLLSGR